LCIKTTDIVNHRRTAALEGLPLFLRENPTELFKKCKVCIKDFKRLKGLVHTVNNFLVFLQYSTGSKVASNVLYFDVQ